MRGLATSSLIQFIVFCLVVLPVALFSNGHPTIAISEKEATAIRMNSGKYPAFDTSLEMTREEVGLAMQQEIEVPPPGEAGGYEHEKHKQNYRDMQKAGMLFTLTGEEKYAAFVRDILDRYADLYPTLGPHPLSHKQKPGKLFHQTLNEEVWLVHAAQAYDCIYDWLSAEERKRFEENIFRKMVHLFAVEYEEELDRIHNHGIWAVAAVGLTGYVLGESDWVEKALLGSKKDGEGGFLKQLDLLFSPDGYYLEGPYYIRYALRPIFLLADAVERNEPDRKIFQHRDQILEKIYYAAAKTVFPDGIFPPINDASSTMNIADIGPLIATNITYHRYGGNDNLLAISRIQGRVMLNGAGLAIAKDLAEAPVKPLAWKSVELSDGFDGERGGLGILRMGQGSGQTMLLMKYGLHGKGHGHFDKLNFIFYDQKRQVIPDYGFARFINIETKFGGRYLPENDSYAKQTIAHNTVVVDEASQNAANRRAADKVWAERHFFNAEDDQVKAMSARANQHYDGVKLQRTMLMVQHEKLDHPVVIDLFRIESDVEHQYDFPLHFNGQLMTTNVTFGDFGNQQAPLGDSDGYQHIWYQANAKTDGGVQFTWLDGHRYYTFTTAGAKDSEVILGRIGANDPNFNLRSEPLLVVRRQAAGHLFASVLEPHGYFNEAKEISRNARGMIQSVAVIGHDETASIIEIKGKNDIRWQVMVNNGDATTAGKSVTFGGETYQWDGNFKVLF